MVGSCHRKPSMAIPPKFQSFIAAFFSGVIPPKAMTLSLITPSFPALVSCSGENAERYPFFDMLSKMGLKTDSHIVARPSVPRWSGKSGIGWGCSRSTEVGNADSCH